MASEAKDSPICVSQHCFVNHSLSLLLNVWEMRKKSAFSIFSILCLLMALRVLVSVARFCLTLLTLAPRAPGTHSKIRAGVLYPEPRP